jgi:hypothetical protein
MSPSNSWLGYPESNQDGNKKIYHEDTAFEGVVLLLFYPRVGGDGFVFSRNEGAWR